MATTMFLATHSASQEITRAFDMVWALDTGLWNLRTSAAKYFGEHPEVTNKDAQDALVEGLYVHGLNLKRIAHELTWEYEEQYIAELLLTYAIAIFDAWVDSSVDTMLLSASNNNKKTIKANVKKGDFLSLDTALSQEPNSGLAGCFHIPVKRQDAHIEKLRLVYKYFKSCRNCCAHGNHQFTDLTEANYESIKYFTADDCGVKEIPKIPVTKEGDPLKLILRGVVGFYDILIRIINHYDVVAADKVAVERELIKRWSNIPSVNLSPNAQKRNNSIRNYIKSVNMCPPYVTKTDDIYNFLVANHAIK
jgi:hypothetical protein